MTTLLVSLNVGQLQEEIHSYATSVRKSCGEAPPPKKKLDVTSAKWLVRSMDLPREPQILTHRSRNNLLLEI
jgi:hypothetical protein